MNPWKALVLTALCAAALASCGGSDTPQAVPTPAMRQVTYDVSGDVKSASITVQTPTGTSQQSDIAVPLLNKAGSPGIRLQMKPGAFVYIAAQNTDTYSSGEITCRITSNGKVISEVTSSGSAAIATCKGSA